MNRVARLDPEGYAALGIDDSLTRDVELDYQVRELDGLNLRRDAVHVR